MRPEKVEVLGIQLPTLSQGSVVPELELVFVDGTVVTVGVVLVDC